MLLNTANVLLQQGGGPEAIILVLLVLNLAVLIAHVAGMWKTFSKAGKPGWAAIIPIYNLYVMLKIGGNAWWWLLLLLVPFVNIYASYKLHAGVSRAFGQGIGFALGLWILPFVFFPLLGFSDYTHRGTPA